jgi:hypothetical protein
VLVGSALLKDGVGERSQARPRSLCPYSANSELLLDYRQQLTAMLSYVDPEVRIQLEAGILLVDEELDRRSVT